MTKLRTSEAIKYQSIRFTRIGLVVLSALGLYGCGAPVPPENDPTPIGTTPPIPGTNDPSWLTSRENLPPPDTDRIEYDREKRTLILYDLPGRDNWMVQLPDEKIGHPVGPQYRLPEGVDTARTLVFYSRPGVKISLPVTVAQIEAGRLAHSSLALGR